MSDTTGAAFGALLTAAAHHHHVQEPEFKAVRLKLRQRTPGAMDLTCNETLPAEPVAVARPLARTVVVVPAQPIGATAPRCDEVSVNALYWSKHKVLGSMMDGFAHTLVAQLDKLDKTGREKEHTKATQLSAIVKEKRPLGTRPVKLKTIADHECLDEMIAVVCKMHTKIVNHAAHGRFRSQGGKGPIPLS